MIYQSPAEVLRMHAERGLMERFDGSMTLQFFRLPTDIHVHAQIRLGEQSVTVTLEHRGLLQDEREWLREQYATLLEAARELQFAEWSAA